MRADRLQALCEGPPAVLAGEAPRGELQIAGVPDPGQIMDHPPMVLMNMRRELLAVRAHCDVPDMLAEHDQAR